MSNPSQKDISCIMNMLDSIKKIQAYSKQFKNADEFYNDSKTFDAAMMNFIIIGEMVDKLSEKFIKDSSIKIDWINVKGFRNIIAHNYFGIDAEEVWQIIHDSLMKLKKELEYLIK